MAKKGQGYNKNSKFEYFIRVCWYETWSLQLKAVLNMIYWSKHVTVSMVGPNTHGPFLEFLIYWSIYRYGM